MPQFSYRCTALPVEGGHQVHPIDIPQERIDAYDPPSNSRMGRAESKPGEPPQVVFCDVHQGWALLEGIAG